MQRALDSELEAIASYIDGKSRSEIGRLRDAKIQEARTLGTRIARAPACDGDNFPATRDARRVRELRRGIAYLTSIFESPPDDGPKAA